jgi:CBS domain-containing protein
MALSLLGKQKGTARWPRRPGDKLSRSDRFQKISMKVSQILTPNPQCITPDTSLTAAAREMRALDVGMLPICDGGRLVGTLTDRDITVRATATGANPNTTPVRDAMTQEVIYCFDDEEVEEAAQIMEARQIRRLPVLTRQKRLIGILSLGDLAVRTQRDVLAAEVLERVSEPVGIVR